MADLIVTNCAACGEEDYVYLDVKTVNNSAWINVYGMRQIGHIELIACTRCGTVRLPESTLMKIHDERRKQ